MYQVRLSFDLNECLTYAAVGTIQDAADNCRLNSKTYQKLMLGVALKSSCYLVAFLLAQSLWSPVFCGLYPTLAAASVTFSSLLLRQILASSGDGDVMALLPSWPSEGGSATGKAYFMLGALFLSLAALCLVSGSGQGSSVSDLLLRTSAPGGVLAATSCFVLQVRRLWAQNA